MECRSSHVPAVVSTDRLLVPFEAQVIIPDGEMEVLSHLVAIDDLTHANTDLIGRHRSSCAPCNLCDTFAEF